MFYPIQIPTILDPIFKKYIDYQEFHFEKTADYIMCVWVMQADDISNETIYNTVLPDGCIDLIFDFSTKTIGFAATYKATVKQQIDTPFDFMGIRFRPGSFYALYNFPSEAVIDAFIPYEILETQLALKEVFTFQTLTERLTFIEAYLLKKIKPTTDRLWVDLVNKIYDENIEDYLHVFKEQFNYSDKTLYRLFKRHYGFSPKAFLNILRFHKSLSALLLEQSQPFTDIALITSFYDQPHFNHEIKKYCGISPRKLLDIYK